ncbi:hypothetical protein GCM10029963_79830 [Micromonospora andamanensis]
MKQYVWQCSLSLPAQEGQLDDETWGRIAGRFVQEMGFTGDADRAGCRWIAVRHGLSAKGNDHVHLVVTLATEDGSPVWLRQDKRRSQQVADRIEDEFGLGKWTPGRAGVTRRPELTRPEVDRARDSGLAPDRELLRRQVRAALAGADSETDWVARMKGAGLLVAARTAAKDVDQVVGYAVALRPAGGGKPRWFAGRNLDGDLSLTRLRARWSDEGRATADQWADAHSTESPRLRAEDRVAVWRASATALEAISGRLRACRRALRSGRRSLAPAPSCSPGWPLLPNRPGKGQSPGPPTASPARQHHGGRLAPLQRRRLPVSWAESRMRCWSPAGPATAARRPCCLPWLCRPPDWSWPWPSCAPPNVKPTLPVRQPPPQPT